MARRPSPRKSGKGVSPADWRYRSFAKSRLAHVLERIDSNLAGDFPHLHSKEALQRVRTRFAEALDSLQQLDRSFEQRVFSNRCSQSLKLLADFLPRLGFILRSTNVRNAFELHAPLTRLARDLINGELKLLLSSEWQLFPFTEIHRTLDPLENFVFIGFPASESDKVLVAQLAGHELGHSLWLRYNLGKKYLRLAVENARTELLEGFDTRYKTSFPFLSTKQINARDQDAEAVVAQAARPAVDQCKEYFCDAVGLALFGESFLHAFAFVLAPGLLGSRVFEYPPIQDRVEALSKVGRRFGVRVPSGYRGQFPIREMDPPRSRAGLLNLSDVAASSLIPEIVSEVESLNEAVGLCRWSEPEIAAILTSFQFITPHSSPKSLADILIAGWRAHYDQRRFWRNRKDVHERRDEVLNELVLKTVEVLEIEHLRRGEAR